MPTTYLPLSSRIVVILHLSLAFWVLASAALSPFLGSHLELKSRLLLHQNVMGKNIEASNEEKSRLNRNIVRFSSLPEPEKQVIESSYQTLTEKQGLSFSEKWRLATKRVLFGTPPFLQAWVIFSLIIGIFLLKRIAGSQTAAFLPLFIGIVYSINNLLYAPLAPLSPDQELYPTEAYIVNTYLKEPLSPSIFAQQNQLKEGFETYLITEWAKKPPSSDPQTHALQVEEGEFFFTLAKIKALKDEPLYPNALATYKNSLAFSFFFLGWNLFFYLFIRRKKAFDLINS